MRRRRRKKSRGGAQRGGGALGLPGGRAAAPRAPLLPGRPHPRPGTPPSPPGAGRAALTAGERGGSRGGSPGGAAGPATPRHSSARLAPGPPFEFGARRLAAVTCPPGPMRGRGRAGGGRRGPAGIRIRSAAAAGAVRSPEGSGAGRGARGPLGNGRAAWREGADGSRGTGGQKPKLVSDRAASEPRGFPVSVSQSGRTACGCLSHCF
ncbi:hypothetical protein LUU34_01089400 [Aix galericulata]|nr:hypothetical protein LUU34_01089400 [Aix galericulata]